MRDDGLANIGLPDAHHGDTIVRYTRGIDQTITDGKRTDRRRQVAAVTAPVNEGLINRDLTKQIINIVIRLAAFGQDSGLTGAGGRTTHAINLFAIWVGAADDTHQQLVTRRAGLLRWLGQVLQAKENAFAGAATQVGGGDFDLG